MEDILPGVARARRPAAPKAEHLQLEKEVVGLWFEMQGRLQAHFTGVAAEHDLSVVQAKVLMQLQPEGAATMRTLADQLQYDSSNLTGVIDRLEDRGIVRRQPDREDRRVKGVRLTPEGVRLRQAFWNRLTGDTGPLGRLGGEELAAMGNLIRAALAAP